MLDKEVNLDEDCMEESKDDLFVFHRRYILLMITAQ